MQRAARTPLEAKFVANIHTVLPILLGEPDQDDGREFVYHDAVGKVAITYSREDPSSTGVFVRRHDNLGGAGFDLLELFELTEDDVAQVLADTRRRRNAGAAGVRKAPRPRARRPSSRSWPRRATTMVGSSATWPAAVCLEWRTTSDW